MFLSDEFSRAFRWSVEEIFEYFCSPCRAGSFNTKISRNRPIDRLSINCTDVTPVAQFFGAALSTYLHKLRVNGRGNERLVKEQIDKVSIIIIIINDSSSSAAAAVKNNNNNNNNNNTSNNSNNYCSATPCRSTVHVLLTHCLNIYFTVVQRVVKMLDLSVIGFNRISFHCMFLRPKNKDNYYQYNHKNDCNNTRDQGI